MAAGPVLILIQFWASGGFFAANSYRNLQIRGPEAEPFYA